MATKQATKQASAAQVTPTKDMVEDDGEEEIESFRTVDDLASAGIGQADITKLKEAGFASIGNILQSSSKDLAAIRGFSEAKVNKVIEAARKLDPAQHSRFRTGLELMAVRKRVIKITTGAKALDAILGGGVETSSLTEVFGEFRTGKTQLMHTLCVSSQLARGMGGAQGRAVYLDTEGNFRPERIVSISERFGLNPEDTLENVIHARVFTHEHQMEAVKDIMALAVTDGPIRVVIIDSVMALFRTEFCGRGELSERQQKLGRHMLQLTRLAEEFNVAVVYCNQTMSDPGAMAMFAVPKPVGGHVLAHASTTRVFLKKGKGEERIARIFDSPSMPEADATFCITNGGIRDVA